MRYLFLKVRTSVSLVSLAIVMMAIILLTACSGPKVNGVPSEVTRDAEVSSAVAEEQSPDLSAATTTPYPTATPSPTSTPPPTSTPIPTVVPTAMATVAPTQAPASLPPQPTPAGTATTTDASLPGITRLEDTDPGPPFTIQVDTIRIEGGKYKVTGVVRNYGSETYEGIGVIGTFYTWGPSGDGTRSGGMYPHGPASVHCPCPFLETGAECPFSLEIYERNYVAYGLHPTGQPAAFHTWHEPASVTVSTLSVSNDGIDNVRITGMVTNKNDFTVKSATVAGVLLDTDGRVVSEGSTLVLGGIEPGASASFDLRIKHEPYARYELYIQAIRY